MYGHPRSNPAICVGKKSYFRLARFYLSRLLSGILDLMVLGLLFAVIVLFGAL